MSDGSLSQDEIDALLAGGGGMDLGDDMEPTLQAGGAAPSADGQGVLSLLGGLTASLASNLSGMFGKNVEVGVPTGNTVSRNDLMAGLADQVVTLRFDLSGGVAGEHAYLIASDTARSVAGLMMGQGDVELNDAALSALEEAGNAMAGSLVTEISERAGESVTSDPGQVRLVASDDIDLMEGTYLRVTFPISVDGEDAGEIDEVFSVQAASAIDSIVRPSGGAQAATAGRPKRAGSPAGGRPPRQGAAGPQIYGQTGGGNPASQQAGVQAVQFPSLSSPGAPLGGDQGNIGLLMDVYMEMTVELGRTRKLIRDILGMGEGTIIELDKLAGEPVDILVNHKLIAKGEVVVIDENFGVRVTEIVSPLDRVSDM